MAGVLEGVLECYVFFAKLVVGRGGAREVDWGDGGRVGGGDWGLLGWGMVE